MPDTYDCTWQVITNFALLDIELERESFILKPLATCWRECGTWTEVQVCTSDTREEIVL